MRSPSSSEAGIRAISLSWLTNQSRVDARMLKELLFPSTADVAVLSVDASIEIVRVDAQCIADGAVCPVCGVWSNRVHRSYLRFPADVPSGGRSVALQLRVRRFTRGNSGCGRRTFVEQIPGLTRRHGQRTERLRSTLAAVGLALAGRAGARIARVLGISVSRSTVLRLVDALPDPRWPRRGWSTSTSAPPARAATTASEAAERAVAQHCRCQLARTSRRFFHPPDSDQAVEDVDDELGRGAWLRTRLVTRRSAPCAYQVTDAQRWLGPPVSRCLR
ncbi:transposase family protein [Streptomyces sp. NPDC002540]